MIELEGHVDHSMRPTLIQLRLRQPLPTPDNSALARRKRGVRGCQSSEEESERWGTQRVALAASSTDELFWMRD
jgi:hypothetical protein